jgi:hypothetical protein
MVPIVRWAFLVLMALSLLWIIGGCSLQTHQKTLLIFLFDETDSFVRAGHWGPSIAMARGAIEQLRPGDAVGVVGIDHHGFDSDDLRLPVTVFAKSSMRAVIDRRAVTEKLAQLQPRKTSSGFALPNGKVRGTPRGTDTLGALEQAAQLATYYPGMRVRIMVFSDMCDEPGSSPSGYSGDKHPFSGECKIKVYFVKESGGKQWKTLVAKWEAAFNELGATCTSTDFCAPGISSGTSLREWLK